MGIPTFFSFSFKSHLCRQYSFILSYISVRHNLSTSKLHAFIGCLLPPQMKLREGHVFTPVCDSAHRGVGLCQWGSLSWGSLSRGSLSGGPRGVSSKGISVQGETRRPPIWWKRRQYASYWNAFLFLLNSCYDQTN